MFTVLCDTPGFLCYSMIKTIEIGGITRFSCNVATSLLGSQPEVTWQHCVIFPPFVCPTIPLNRSRGPPAFSGLLATLVQGGRLPSHPFSALPLQLPNVPKVTKHPNEAKSYIDATGTCGWPRYQSNNPNLGMQDLALFQCKASLYVISSVRHGQYTRKIVRMIK